MSLNTQILLGTLFGLLLGAGLRYLGVDEPFSQQVLYFSGLMGSLFIDLLKMILTPLIFTSIAIGVANLRVHDQMHKVWQITLLCSLLTTTLSIIIGLSAAHIFHPGQGLTLLSFQEATHGFQAAQLTLPEFFQKFLHGLFVNPFAALSQGIVLPIVVFALFVGIAIAAQAERYPQTTKLLEEGFALTMTLVRWVMVLAPFGIMALLTKLVATENPALLGSLAKFVAVVTGTTVFHGLIVLPLILFTFARVSPLRFWRGARPALLTAFATSSSSATMPVTMDCLEKELGVSRGVTGFVVPLGAHLNMDGTALYEAAAALFVANLAGIDPTLTSR